MSEDLNYSNQDIPEYRKTMQTPQKQIRSKENPFFWSDSSNNSLSKTEKNIKYNKSDSLFGNGNMRYSQNWKTSKIPHSTLSRTPSRSRNRTPIIKSTRRDDNSPVKISLFENLSFPSRTIPCRIVTPKKERKEDTENTSFSLENNSSVLITSQKQNKFIVSNEILPSLSKERQKKETNKEVSIEDFDPSKPRKITESLTLKAMENLGVSFKELCFPTKDDLARYSQNEKMESIAEERLKRRAKVTVANVKKERSRLKENSEKVYTTTTRGINDTKDSESFNAVERARIKHLEDKNKQLTEDVFFSMYMARINEEERVAEEQKKKEEKKARDSYLVEKKKRDLEETEAKANERDRITREMHEKREEKLNLEDQRLKKFEEKKKIEAENNRKKYEDIEKERSLLRERLEQKREEEKIMKQEQFKAKEMERSVFEEELKKEKEKEQLELQKKNQENEEKAADRVAKAKIRYEKSLEEKRKKTNDKLIKQENKHMILMKKRKEELEQTKLENERKAEIKLRKIKKKEAHLQMMKENNLKMKEERSNEVLKQRESDIERFCKERSVLEQMKAEDNHKAYEMHEKQRMAMIHESEEKYEAKMEKLRLRDEQRQQVEIMNKKTRSELEFEREKIISKQCMGNVSSLLGKSDKEVKQIANKLGVDFNKIQERAQKTRKILK